MLTMFDAIYVKNLPPTGKYFAGYCGGSWPTYAEVVKQYPNATVLSIAVNASEDASCLDVERYDATPDQAQANAARPHPGVRPGAYA